MVEQQWKRYCKECSEDLLESNYSFHKWTTLVFSGYAEMTLITSAKWTFCLKEGVVWLT